MFLKLLCVVTDFVPCGLTAYKLMKLIANNGIIVQAVSCDGKGILLRVDLTESRAAFLAEAPGVFKWWPWLVMSHKLAALYPPKRVLLYENKSTCSYFPAPRAMTRPHHAWRGREFELDGATATTSFDHLRPLFV
jgi:hypothetical protein